MKKLATSPFLEVAIVGGGAAGLACGIFAARRGAGQGIVVLDGASRLGAKILVAGGGRCNVTNREVSAGDFCGGSSNVIKRVLASFGVEQTIEFFRDIGVELKEEEHGKLFPTTNRAQTVLHALLGEAERCGVVIRAGHRVTGIERDEDGFRIETTAGVVRARQVVLATGGQSLPKTGSDGGGFDLARGLGHTVTALTPGLVGLVLADEFHEPLSGISQDVELTVRGAKAKAVRIDGAMLWTRFGVSGPAVLDASRHWHRARIEGCKVSVTANFFPGDDFESVERQLLEWVATRPTVHLRNMLSRWLPGRVAEAVLDQLGIDGATPMAHLPRDLRRKLVHGLTAWPLAVEDSRGYGRAEVTAGGVPLSEIDPHSMASRKCPGLFLVGEILDVDGRIGGFNFQWAWSSAWVAGGGVAGAIGTKSGGKANRLK